MKIKLTEKEFVTEAIGFKYKDGFDRYYSVYAPACLSISDYNEIHEKFY